MYPGKYATQHPDRPAFIMANSGESVSYAEYEARSNRLAHLLRTQGLKRLDHHANFMENNNRYLEAGSAGYRAGLYFTCINSYLTAEELAYIVNNSESKLLITSRAKMLCGTDQATPLDYNGNFQTSERRRRKCRQPRRPHKARMRRATASCS
jgi:long-chain acyl-CoA synthetase